MLRYEERRSSSPVRDRRLFSSLAEVGQQVPIVVVSLASSEQPLVIDGYKRVRLLRRLGQDAVRATAWALGQADALLLKRMLRVGDADNALELGWFLRELGERFGLSGEDLSKRFGRTPSWVSRRLSLVEELPESVQARVRAGTLGAHAAMKCLVPLARANRADGERLADAVASLLLTTRQVAIVHAAWLGANAELRRPRPAGDRASARDLARPGQGGARGGHRGRARDRARREGRAVSRAAPGARAAVQAQPRPRARGARRRRREALDARVTVPEHRPPRSQKVFARDAPSPEERELSRGGDEVIALVALLKRHGRSLRTLRRLAIRMRDYPCELLLAAVRIATHHGLDDIDRRESLVLRRVARDFFPLPPEAERARLGGARAELDAYSLPRSARILSRSSRLTRCRFRSSS
ncbi:hypothetical protein WMF11_38020 [Sorangium sp. So ce295]|uniref:ParB/RepB/Spo0J family partition protein n=1 Tax=Sorangium sp. So ce295 TaxID=3133295 RepID=UPI003F5EF595